MPIYMYECGDCCHKWDESRKISDRDGGKCPKCMSDNISRPPQGGTFLLRGGGWAASGYNKPGVKK